MDKITWPDNKVFMCKLWPRWKPDENLAALLNARWSHLRQDKLRECIENHRFERDSTPDIAAIQKAYGALTGASELASAADREVDRTRADATQPMTAAEEAAWDAHVERILATASAEEIAAVRERLTFLPMSSRRMLGLAVEYCRKNPR